MKKNIQNDIIRQILLHGFVTRKDLVELLEIRPASLYAAMDKLTDIGLLHEPERHGKRTGRKASVVKFDKEYAYFAGVELRPREVLGSVINLSGDVITTLKGDFDPCLDADQLISTLLDFVNTLIKKSKVPVDVFAGIGFADPGLVDQQRQISVVAVNIDNWRNLETGRLLREGTGIQNVIVESGANARTFMEYSLMIPDLPDSFFHMELGYGVGGGFIKESKLFCGSTNCGMEIGHLIIDQGGALCQCGNRGCLEAMVSTAAIKRKVEYLIEHGVHSMLSKSEFSIDNFIEAVNSNDKGALSIANEICGSIAVALQAVVALINPKIIMLSGGLTGMGDMMLNIIRQHLELNCQPTAVSGVQIKISSINDFGTAQGAALLARKEYLFNYI